MRCLPCPTAPVPRSRAERWEHGGFGAGVPWALVAAGTGCEMGNSAVIRRCRLLVLCLELLYCGCFTWCEAGPSIPASPLGALFCQEINPLESIGVAPVLRAAEQSETPVQL